MKSTVSFQGSVLGSGSGVRVCVWVQESGFVGFQVQGFGFGAQGRGKD